MYYVSIFIFQLNKCSKWNFSVSVIRGCKSEIVENRRKITQKPACCKTIGVNTDIRDFCLLKIFRFCSFQNQNFNFKYILHVSIKLCLI